MRSDTAVDGHPQQAVIDTGASFADLSTQSVPVMAGAAVLAAGLSQISRWKAHQRQCCSHRLEAHASSDVSRAWIDGLRLGMSCVCCCASLTTLLVVFGLMDGRVMTIVTIARALERSQRIGVRVARLTGVIAAATGAWLLARAALG